MSLLRSALLVAALAVSLLGAGVSSAYADDTKSGAIVPVTDPYAKIGMAYVPPWLTDSDPPFVWEPRFELPAPVPMHATELAPR